MSTIKIAACRPKVWTYPMAETPIYSGSIEGSCAACDVTVLIGPMVQAEVLASEARARISGSGDVVVACFACAVRLSQNPDDVEVRSLGNREFG